MVGGTDRGEAVAVAEQIVAFRRAVEARLAGREEPVPRSLPGELSARFGLSEPAAGFVWACVAVASDPMMYPHLIAVGGVDGRRGLTPATYAALTGVDELEVLEVAYWLSQEPPIVTFGMLERDGLDYLPIATPYRASARLLAHVGGGVRAAVSGRFVPVQSGARHDDAQRAALRALGRALEAGRAIVLEGPRGVGRSTAVAGYAASRDLRVIAIDASTLELDAFDRAARAACAEAILLGAIPVIRDVDRLLVRDADRPLIAPSLARIIDAVHGPIVVTASTPGLEVSANRPVERVVLPVADASTRLALWEDALGAHAADPAMLRDIALRHKLTPGQIAEAAHHAAAIAGAGTIRTTDVFDGIRHTLADRFGALAERLTVSDDWSDIVLPAETLDQLAALVARVEHAWTVFEDWRFPRQTARGGGVAALFSGPPGTGKTMVAGLIARELGRDLYRIDLSQIISKWVGETEKQLGQVFDAAEAGNTLLLFDEADSLFAKRTEVKSSSDRYANLEVNYLLQRIETFGGVTILTTNLDTSIDPALRRRLAAHVVFWPPEYEERVALWQRFLTTQAPVEDRIDVGELASEYPDMTGANIRNAALAAAFLAARENGGLSHERVHRAARAEYRAMGRMLAGKR